jgi:plastocyanin
MRFVASLRPPTVGATALALAMVTFGATVAVGAADTTKATTTATKPATKNATTPAKPAASSTAQQRIDLKSLQFRPNKITVKPGTKIVFVWKETVSHNVVFDKKGPRSTVQNKGTWSPQDKDASALSKPGTSKYKCTLHPGMNGQITVK